MFRIGNGQSSQTHGGQLILASAIYGGGGGSGGRGKISSCPWPGICTMSFTSRCIGNPYWCLCRPHSPGGRDSRCEEKMGNHCTNNKNFRQKCFVASRKSGEIPSCTRKINCLRNTFKKKNSLLISSHKETRNQCMKTNVAVRYFFWRSFDKLLKTCSPECNSNPDF